MHSSRNIWFCYIVLLICMLDLCTLSNKCQNHYGDVIMGTIASQITSLTIVYSTVNSGADQRKHQRSASLAFVRGIHRGPVNFPHKWPVTRKMFPFDDVIMTTDTLSTNVHPHQLFRDLTKNGEPPGPPHTVRCRYNAVKFLPNPHKIHPIACPLGRDMGCNLWFDILVYILLQSTQCGIWNIVLYWTAL